MSRSDDVARIESDVKQAWEEQAQIGHARVLELLETGVVARAAAHMIDTLQHGGTIYAIGNGGSYAEAMHFCAELAVKFRTIRHPLSAMALPTDLAGVLAHCNDFGDDGRFYDSEGVVQRQVAAHIRPEDTLLGLTTSCSWNIMDSLHIARRMKAHSVLLCGAPPTMPHGDTVILDCQTQVPMQTAQIQVVHLILLHTLADVVERHFV